MSEVSSEALSDIHKGLAFCFLANTDNKESTIASLDDLKTETLAIITGSEELARLPLTKILKECMDLTLDCDIDISDLTPGGHVIDTQGFIAHNDDTIVLSYRGTSSKTDIFTDIQLTTSVWEVEEDSEKGYSGFGSSLRGHFKGKPRVHTGFYNAFLASLPMIKQYIEPLLQADQPPRKLWVTGHSLGGALATLATFYFFEFFDWKNLPHSLCLVTAGCPRTCGEHMQEKVRGLMAEFESSKVQIYRLETESDFVPNIPPKSLGFRHIVSPIVINGVGKIVVSAISREGSDRSIKSNDSTDSVEQLARGVSPESLESVSTLEEASSPSLSAHLAASYLKPVCKAMGLLSDDSSLGKEEIFL